MKEIYKKNEYETNEVVAKAILILFGFILLIAICCYVGIFDIYPYMMNGFLIASLLPLLLPTLLVPVLHIDKAWIKYALITLLAVETGIAYVIFTFQMLLIFLVPTIIATFYLDKKVIYYSGVVTSIAIMISHVSTGFYLFQPWIEPFQDLKRIMLYGALPRVLQLLFCTILLVLLSNRFLSFMNGFQQVLEEDGKLHESEGRDKKKEELFALLEQFTEREKEVFELLVKGNTNAQIANQLCLSVGTVKNYVTMVYDKLGCRERTSIVLKYSRYYHSHEAGHDQSHTNL